jgi:glycosyltransferase involved in cell wall biosynthesis
VEDRRRTWGLEGKFVVEYSGNLGRVHELGAVLAAAETLRGEEGIVFLFVGGGARRREVQAEAARRGLDRIVWQPAQPRAELAAALGAGDAHWITLRPGCENYVYPSKLYGAAAAGRPALFVGPPGAEPARTITAAGLGYAFAPEDAAGIADCLRRLSRDPAEREAIAGRARRFAALAPLASAVATWDRLLEDGRADDL